MTQAVTTLLRSLDPATGDVVGEVPVTPVSEIPARVRRSRSAQPAWAALGIEGRVRALAEAGSELAARSEELGRLITREMGKPLAEATGEVRSVGSGWAEGLEEIALALQPDVLEDARTRSVVYHDPFGVCAAITPWNFPVAMPHELVLPALVAGNTVLLKPSEETPLSGEAYADALRRRLPEDVLQVVHGADAQGKALVEADVDLIAFTGSRETGKKILAAAAPGLKRVILELGGKDPMIVLDDADLEKAASFAVHNAFRNAGQVCVSTERIYVHERVAAAFESLVKTLTEKLVVGEGTREGVRVGPMVSAEARDRVLQVIEEARAKGARVVAGGTGHHGNFVMPTVLADVAPSMRIAEEETFGPVACLTRFGSDAEAVTLANGTPYGLGAVVFGRDETRALGVARRLDAGMIGVNKSCGGAGGTPWVGAKQSGYGYHSSRDGHRQFAQTRVVSAPRA